ncbi:MAG: MFS transporter [Pseudomonadota bacterium]
MVGSGGTQTTAKFGLTLFAVASVGCAWASSLEFLLVCRVLQGLGGAVLMVLPRAVIRDLHTGLEAMRVMAMVMLVVSVSPMVAPLIGSGPMAFGTWRIIFWVLAGAALLGLGLTARAVPETHAKEERTEIDVAKLAKDAMRLLRDTQFMGLTLIGGFGFGSFMVFIANASFVYGEQFGLTPTGFSIAFAVNALGFFASSQFAGPMGVRFGPVRVIR